jgi:hypothetical protein
VDFVGELDAGGRRADDQHATFRQRIRIAVVERRDARDGRRHGLMKSRHAREIAGAAGQDDDAALQLAMVGGDVISPVRWPHRRDRGARAHGRGGHDRETRDEIDHLAHRHVAVRIGAVVAKAGQAALPVRREQPQRVPALAPPGVRNFPALEHQMIDRPLGEAAARREAGMPGADDDRRDPFDDSAPRGPCRPLTPLRR